MITLAYVVGVLAIIAGVVRATSARRESAEEMMAREHAWRHERYEGRDL